MTNSTTLTLKTPYTGTSQLSGTPICYGATAAQYLYLLYKSDLPTDNTWKYFERYFGVDGKVWDGGTSKLSWEGIPYNTTRMQLMLNYYTNDGTVPLKFSDIRIEEVGVTGNGRQEQKIQFKKFD